MNSDFLQTPNSALLVVDVQNDFCANGSLATPDAESIIPIINDYAKAAANQGMPVIYSRDWHPDNHCSFITEGGLWPPHCVQNTHGAELNAKLLIPAQAVIANKAFIQDVECYSALSASTADTNEVVYAYLKSRNITTIWVVGLALDYCVFASAQEGLAQGFKVNIITTACRSIDAAAGQAKLQELQSLGAKIYAN